MLLKFVKWFLIIINSLREDFWNWFVICCILMLGIKELEVRCEIYVYDFKVDFKYLNCKL